MNVASAQVNDTLQKELVLRLAPSKNNPRNSEGSFVTLKSGRILFIYSHYTGASSDDHASAYLASRYSDDGGKTWSANDIKVVEKEGLMNVMSVSLLRLQNGAIAFFYLRKNSETDCTPMLRMSTDEAQTWSEPRQCITDRKGYFVLNNDRVIQLPGGRLIMPVALHHSDDKIPLKAEAYLFAYYSDDNGATWTSSREVPNKDTIVTQEPGVVLLKDGRLAMFIRTDMGHQYVSYSSNNGQSWTPIKPWTLPSPLSPASVKTIPGTKKLLAVWNDRYAYKEGYKPNRFPLTVATSRNGGKRWKKKWDIETAPTRFCYTAIHFTKHHVLLGYCSGSLEQTDIVRLPLRYFK